MSKYSHLWNDLPIEVRKRLMPCLIESQILHLRQARELIVHHHAEELRELDSWIKNCERSLLPLLLSLLLPAIDDITYCYKRENT
jgi:hypothetical protein